MTTMRDVIDLIIGVHARVELVARDGKVFIGAELPGQPMHRVSVDNPLLESGWMPEALRLLLIESGENEGEEWKYAGNDG